MTKREQIYRRERAYLMHQRLKRVHPLRQLFWECTLRCNLSCLHCGSDCKAVADVPEMPLADFLPVLDEIKLRQPDERLYVHTVGGEPLVRRDIVEAGRAITERGFRWGMVSNGYLLDRPMLKDLLDAGLFTIAIDLDGTRDDHNWLRNSNKSFDRAMTAVDALVAANRDGRDVLWDVITCVNARNIHHLEEIKRMLIDAGVKMWRCFTIVPMGRAKEQPEMLLTDEQLKYLFDFIMATRREGKIALSYACEGYLGTYEGLVRGYMFSCRSGLTVASVRSDGNISGCLSVRSDFSQGNIYRDSFWDVWQNKFQIYRDREWMRTGVCADCEAFKYCEGNGFHLRDEHGQLMLCNYQRLKALHRRKHNS